MMLALIGCGAHPGLVWLRLALVGYGVPPGPVDLRLALLSYRAPTKLVEVEVGSGRLRSLYWAGLVEAGFGS